SALVRIVRLGERAFGADPSDGGAGVDAPRAATASSDVSYGVNGNPVMASSSPSSTHEASELSSPAGASFGRCFLRQMRSPSVIAVLKKTA
ncbi:hypothetical protein THAOC_30688, partial [Thalassiosira oceanica]